MTYAASNITSIYPAAARATGDSVSSVVLQRIDELRSIVMERIREGNSQSESSVLEIGKQLESIVEQTRSYGDQLAESVGAIVLDRNDERNVPRAIDELTLQVESFVRELTSSLDKQVAVSDQAATSSKGILSLVRAVEDVAMQSRILALNARVEASRTSASGEGFNVIAQEMGRLSKQIAQANSDISDLADGLLTQLPVVSEVAGVLADKTQAFRGELEITLGRVAGGTASLRESVNSLLEQNLAQLTSSAYEVLSNLQFQDPVAQHLLIAEADFENARQAISTVMTEHNLDETVAVATGASLVASGSDRDKAAGHVAAYGDEVDVEAGDVMLF